MNKYKLWITDIDGTIMNYDGSVTGEMKNLIQKINNSGFKLVLATGRMFMGAYHALVAFNLNTPVVCYQGAVVRDKDKVLWCSYIEPNLAQEIITYYRKNNIHTHLYSNDKLYIEDDNKRIMDEYCNGRGTVYEVVDDFRTTNFQNVPKILSVIEDNELMEKTKKELNEIFKDKITIVQSAKTYLEITNKGISKGSALEFLKEYWNIKTEEIIASGDQDNDIEMLKHAGIKVCVGYNSKELLKISDYHFDSVNSNGLNNLIERLVF